MPDNVYSQLRATGYVPAPQWVIQRVSVPIGKQAIDARKPADLEIWPEKGSKVSDTEAQRFWTDASRKYSYPSQWEESSVRGTVAIALKGGGAIDHDITEGSERSAQVTEEKVVDKLGTEFQKNGRQFPATIGVAALLRPLGSPGTRPGFSLLISGPHGGSEAARVFLHAFQELGISGLLARQIEGDQFGIVRGLFLPEWLCHFGDRNAGIDWNVWKTLALSDFEKNFYEAMLVWSDEILKSLLHLQGKARLNIDGISLDSYSAITLVDADLKTAHKEISRLKESGNFYAAEICARYLKTDG